MSMGPVNGDRYSEVMVHVIGILGEITSEWDSGEISPDTRLGSLNLESINFVYFIAELQQKYGLKQTLLARIRAAGLPLSDLSVADIAGFVEDLRGTDGQRREVIS